MPVIRFVVYGLAKVLSKVFGLATMSFFGRLPSRDDDVAAAIGLASITWIPVVTAVFFPALGEFIIPFAPEDEGLLRIIAIVTAILIPVAVGLAAGRLHNQRGPGGRSLWASTLHGFWYTPVIGAVVTALIVVVPLLRASWIVRRYSVQRLLLMVPAGAYDDMLDHVVGSLERRGVEARIEEPGRIMAAMFRSLVFVLGHLFCRDVADELKIIRGEDADGQGFEVTVHAADLTVVGREKVACRVRAVLAEELDERQVYFTWDDDSQRIEDRMREIRDELEDGQEPDLDRVRQLAEDLAALQLDSEEWNNVRRNLYRLERDAYARAAGEAADDPAEQTREVQERAPDAAAPSDAAPSDAAPSDAAPSDAVPSDS